MPPVIDMNECVGCGICDDSCPIDVIMFNKETNSPIVLYPRECWHCGSCRQDCPEGAIKIVFSIGMLISGAGAAVYL